MFTITDDNNDVHLVSDSGGDGEDPIDNDITDHKVSSSQTRPNERNWLEFQEWREYLDRLHREQTLSSSTTNASTARTYRKIESHDSLDGNDSDGYGRLEFGDAERTHYELLQIMGQKIRWLNEIIGSLGRLLQHQTTEANIE